jgi:hypothetical protein
MTAVSETDELAAPGSWRQSRNRANVRWCYRSRHLPNRRLSYSQQETDQIGLAYAFEQVTRYRVPPSSTLPLPSDSVGRP